jgi:hypothetical protein
MNDAPWTIRQFDYKSSKKKKIRAKMRQSADKSPEDSAKKSSPKISHLNESSL